MNRDSLRSSQGKKKNSTGSGGGGGSVSGAVASDTWGPWFESYLQLKSHLGYEDEKFRVNAKLNILLHFAVMDQRASHKWRKRLIGGISQELQLWTL